MPLEPATRDDRADTPSKRRWVVALSVVVLSAGSIWIGLERNDAIGGDVGSGRTGVGVPVGAVFASYYGPYPVREPLVVRGVSPEFDSRGLVLEDTKLFVGPGATPGRDLPHGCQPVMYPSGGGGFLGEARETEGAKLEKGDWFFLVAYFRATEPGTFSTGTTARIHYRQGWWRQKQTLEERGLEVVAEVNDRHRDFENTDLACRITSGGPAR